MPQDLDPVETGEWREAFDSVVEFDGADRAGFLLAELINEARRNGTPVVSMGLGPLMAIYQARETPCWSPRTRASVLAPRRRAWPSCARRSPRTGP